MFPRTERKGNMMKNKWRAVPVLLFFASLTQALLRESLLGAGEGTGMGEAVLTAALFLAAELLFLLPFYSFFHQRQAMGWGLCGRACFLFLRLPRPVLGLLFPTPLP